MPLTEKTLIAEIRTYPETGIISVATDTIIERDGEQISRSRHRHTIAPGDDYSDEAPEVQRHCEAAHTQEVVDAYKAMVAAQS